MSDSSHASAALVAALEAAIGGSLREGAERIANAARANAPVLRTASRLRVPGALRSAIGVKQRPTENGKVRVAVQVDDAEAFYGRFQEEGFHAVGRTKGGRSVDVSSARYVPGLHFMQRAFDANKLAIATDVVANVQSVIDKANAS